MSTLLQSSLILASIALLWRSTLNKNHHIAKYLKKVFPTFLGTALTCGICFTYWVALFFCIFFEPLPVGFFQLKYDNNFFPHLFFSWMTIGFVSVSFRFAFALIQEKLNHYVHTVNGTHGH